MTVNSSGPYGHIGRKRTNMTLQLISPTPAHQQGWVQLYQAYGDFYEHPVSADTLATVWRWLNDTAHPLDCRLAVSPTGGLLGFMHFRAMPRPLHGVEIGFLDDLFVEPSSRGYGVAQEMLEQLAVIAADKEWAVVRWLTADNNYRARGLYDRVAKKTAWNLYEMAC